MGWIAADLIDVHRPGPHPSASHPLVVRSCENRPNVSDGCGRAGRDEAPGNAAIGSL